MIDSTDSNLLHSKVELIQNDELQKITNFLTNLSIGSHIINGKVEAYTSRYRKPPFNRRPSNPKDVSTLSSMPNNPPPPGSYRATGRISTSTESSDREKSNNNRSNNINVELEPLSLVSSISESENSLGLPFLLSEDPSSLPCNNKDLTETITKETTRLLHQNQNSSSANNTGNTIVSGGLSSITKPSVRSRSHSFSSQFVASRRNSFSNDSAFNGLNANDISLILSPLTQSVTNKRRQRASSLNDLSHPNESETILEDFIYSLNLSNPDHDFLPITSKKNFVLENLHQCMMTVNNKLSDLSNVSPHFAPENNSLDFETNSNFSSKLPTEVHNNISSFSNNNNDKFLENLWSNIHEIVNLKTCEIYRYYPKIVTSNLDSNDISNLFNANTSLTPSHESERVCDDSDDDSSVYVWEFFYFFFNRDLSTFVLFSCRAKAAIRVMMKSYRYMNNSKRSEKRKKRKSEKDSVTDLTNLSTTHDPSNPEICSIQNNIIDVDVAVSDSEFGYDEESSDLESDEEEEEDEDEDEDGDNRKLKKIRTNSFSYDNSIGVLAAASDDEDLDNDEDENDPERLVDEYEEIQEKLERRARRYSKSYLDEDE